MKTQSIEFYSPSGWAGDKYDKSLSTKEIARLVRKELKEKYPRAKFSVASSHNNLSIKIKAVPFEVRSVEFIDYKNSGSTDGFYAIYDQAHRLSPEAQALLQSVEIICNAYRFNDCDSMTDYFRVNFWLSVEYDYELTR